MSELHVLLRHEVAAFDFQPDDVVPLERYASVVWHNSADSFVGGLAAADYVATWDFDAGWYERAPALRAVMTPAAGFDWVAHDPRDKVQVHHGSFHGPMMAESLLGMMLHVNRRIPEVVANEAARAWDRDFQANCRMLRNQSAVIVGYGSIGRDCARLLRALGMTVYGVQRTHKAGQDEVGTTLVHESDLTRALASAEHVICLLPGHPPPTF